MTATQENARKWLIDGGGGHEDGEDVIRAGRWSVGSCIEHMAEFADSLTAELQKENARLEKALRELLNVAEKYGIYTNHLESARIATNLALSGAREALNPPKGGAVQEGLSKEKAK